MEIINLGGAGGHPIEKFGSRGALHLPVGHTEGDSALGLITLEADGVLGRHPAVGDQLFIVIDGEGWVTGEDDTRDNIKAGRASLRRAGDSHESGTTVRSVVEGNRHPAISEHGGSWSVEIQCRHRRRAQHG